MSMRTYAVSGAILCVLAALGAYALFAVAPSEDPTGSATVFANGAALRAGESASPEAPLKPRREPPAGFEEYYSERYQFSLIYPESLAVREIDEGAGAATITFQNPDTVQGFQIFVVPYGAEQVSEERFRMDNPSGVREQLLNIAIDGATGTSFFSIHPTLGETAEVWFIRDGYLYEVTTLRPLIPWLSGIMQRWLFL